MVKINILGDFFAGTALTERYLSQGIEALLHKDFSGLLREADLNILNLESPLTTSSRAAKKAGPVLKGDRRILHALSESNFHLATLANNHMMDFGISGLEDTVRGLDSHGIAYVGASLCPRTDGHVFQGHAKGIKVSIINVAEQEFGIVGDGETGVAKEDIGSIFYWLAEERTRSDAVVLVIHGGSELYPLPSPDRFRRARLYVDYGADAVVFHHTHVVSAFEKYNGKPIFYGLGNFLFEKAGAAKSWNTGMMAQLVINKRDDTVTGEPVFFRYENGCGVSALDGYELDHIREHVDSLNHTMGDVGRLRDSWKDFCMERRLGALRLSNLVPRWQGFLLRQGILKRPIFHEKSLLGGLNVLRCAAHREVATTVFEEEARARFKTLV